MLREALTQSWIGRKLGAYEIMSLLGEGGMGEVYLAEDLSLRREVALKIFSTNVMTDPNHLERFKEEARLASSLNHPNIVTIYGVGEEEGVTFIAMELVRGRTLREVLESGRLPLRRALDLAFQICDALAVAHASDIVHRDLKPENVMVTPDERVKVLDFGLAKRHGTFLSETRTVEGTILGTVGYMSPEQATGKPAVYTADQFSFGAIFYEMVTGRRAFARETPMETLSAILSDQPPAARSVNPEVSAHVEQIIERCLAKDPSQRYLDTRRLAQDILAARDGSLDLTPPASLPVSRRRAIWLAGSSVATAVVAAAGWELWPRDAGIGSLAVLPFKTASAEDSGFLSVLVADSLVRQISNVKSLKVQQRDASLTLLAESSDAMTAGRLLHVDGVVSGTIDRRAGRVYITVELTSVRTGLLWRETYDEAESDLLLVNDKIAQKIVSLGLRLKLSDEERTRFARYGTDNWEASELYARALSHQDQEQEEDYVIARDLLEKAIEKDPSFPLAYVALARNYTIMALDGYRRPSEMWPQVYRYTRTALDLDPTLLEANSGLAAEAFYFRWNWQTAEQEYKTAWSAPVNGQSMGWVLLRWALRRYDDALDLVRQARRDQPLSLMWRLREAALLTQMGKVEDGARFYEEIINDQARDARAYFGLAEARRAQERFGEAIDLIRQGSEMDAQGESLPGPLENALSGARSAEAYDRVQKALAQLELNGLSARSGEGYVSPLDFARAHCRLGNKVEALKYLDAALKEPSPGLVFINVDQAWNNLRTESRFNAAIRQIGLP